MSWRAVLTGLLVVAGLAAPSLTLPAAADDITPGGDFVIAPVFEAYVQAHGGPRTFGPPVSNDFLLLGKRVQVFERQVLERRPDGSIAPLSLLDEGLPLVHLGGRTLPSPDADLASSVPALDSLDYTEQAEAAIASGLLDQAAPDEWNGLAVNFGATFRGTLACDELPADIVCDESTLRRAALDFWGLPLSGAASDPNYPDLVYVRFQRGVMQHSESDGQTQPVPLGLWFKRVLIGTELPDDLLAEVAGSRFYAQYAPDLPLGVARPIELHATALTTAFGAAQNPGARLSQTGPATALLAPTLPDFATPTISPVLAPASPALTADPLLAATATPVPQGPDFCAGDEQVLFAPANPYAGTEVLIAATSARHHDVRAVRLAGPVKTEQPKERPGLSGWVWEWTVSLPSEGSYGWGFYVDGARLCASSTFTALPAFGTTPTPTSVGTATATPTAAPTATAAATTTPTGTPTLSPAPSLSSVSPEAGGCNEVLFLQGQNFGSSQTQVSGQVFLVGPSGTRSGSILGWGSTQITVSAPTGALPAGAYNIIVQANGVASNARSYTLRATCA